MHFCTEVSESTSFSSSFPGPNFFTSSNFVYYAVSLLDLSGQMTLDLSKVDTDSSTLNVLVFMLLPNEIIADSAKIRDKKCFKNHVSSASVMGNMCIDC